jgi:hypothetical protein
MVEIGGAFMREDETQQQLRAMSSIDKIKDIEPMHETKSMPTPTNNIDLFIKVPLIKGDDYPMQLFNDLSKKIEFLARENKKWPDVLTFTGHLGKEVIDFIEKKGWDFSKFTIHYEKASYDKLIISYSKKLTQIEDNSEPIRDSLDGKMIEGIPGPKTTQKIIDYSIGGIGYKLEREIDPKLEIKLVR